MRNAIEWNHHKGNIIITKDTIIVIEKDQPFSYDYDCVDG